MSSSIAGMANCNVRMIGDAWWSNGKKSKSCNHATRLRIHCLSYRICIGWHYTRSQAATFHTECCHVLHYMTSLRVKRIHTRPSYIHGLGVHSTYSSQLHTWTGCTFYILVPVTYMDWVYIIHTRSSYIHGLGVHYTYAHMSWIGTPPLVCHGTILQMGEEGNNERRKVNMILQFYMSSSAAFLADTDIC